MDKTFLWGLGIVAGVSLAAGSTIGLIWSREPEPMLPCRNTSIPLEPVVDDEDDED